MVRRHRIILELQMMIISIGLEFPPKDAANSPLVHVIQYSWSMSLRVSGDEAILMHNPPRPTPTSVPIIGVENQSVLHPHTHALTATTGAYYSPFTPFGFGLPVPTRSPHPSSILLSCFFLVGEQVCAPLFHLPIPTCMHYLSIITF